MKQLLIDRVAEIEHYCKGQKFGEDFAELKEAFNRGNYIKSAEIAKRFPTHETLLRDLVKKLRLKSVYKTLKKISKNEQLEVYECVKGLSSLLTHAAIECTKGNGEYKMLIDNVYSKLGELLYGGRI